MASKSLATRPSAHIFQFPAERAEEVRAARSTQAALAKRGLHASLDDVLEGQRWAKANAGRPPSKGEIALAQDVAERLQKHLKPEASRWHTDRPEALRRLLAHAVDNPTPHEFSSYAALLGVPQDLMAKVERLRELMLEVVPIDIRT